MLRKLANQLVHFWRRSEFGSIGPIVQSREHVEDGRRHFEYLWLLRIRRNGNRERRIPLDHSDFLRIVFDNRADVVGATQNNHIGVPPDSITSRLPAAHWLFLRGADVDADPRTGEFARRHVFQIWRLRRLAPPAGAEKVKELTRILDARDVSRGVRLHELTHYGGRLGAQQPVG